MQQTRALLAIGGGWGCGGASVGRGVAGDGRWEKQQQIPFGNDNKSWQGFWSEEVGAMLGRGQRTGVVAAGEAVAQVGDEAIGGVAQGLGDSGGDGGELGPGSGERGEAREDGSGAGAGLAEGGGCEDEDGVGGLLEFDAEAGQQSVCDGGLGRGEAQAVAPVAGEQPADRGVAESAASVEEDEQAVADWAFGGRVGHGDGGGWLHGFRMRVWAGGMQGWGTVGGWRMWARTADSLWE